MTLTIISPDEVLDKWDDGSERIRIGSDVTFVDETDTRVIADPTTITAEPTDPCDKKTVNTKNKFGMGGTDIEWPVGVFRRATPEMPVGRQDLYAPMEMCLSNTVGEHKIWVGIQDVIEGIPLSDALEITNCFGDLGDIALAPNNSSGDLVHILKHKIYELYGNQYEYVGVRWKANSVEAIDALTPDTDAGTYGTYFDKKYESLQYVEWCYMEELEKGDFRHNAYTTIGGTLSGPLTLTVGTYKNTGTTLSTHNVTIDNSGGQIIVKQDKGSTNGFYRNSTGTVTQTNYGTYNTIFTSQWDTSVGEDTGSGGSPALGDYTQLFYTTNVGNVELYNHEVRYCGTNVFREYSNGTEDSTLTIKCGVYKSCGPILICSNGTTATLTHTFEDCKIEDTCSAGSFFTCGNTNTTYAFIDCNFQGTASGDYFRVNVAKAFTFDRCQFLCKETGSLTGMIGGVSTADVTISNCIFDGTQDNTAKGVRFEIGTGETLDLTITNTQFTNFNGTGGDAIQTSGTGGTVNDTITYCNFYNNSTDIANDGGYTVTKGTGCTAVDPGYTTVAPGTTISSNQDDGWASGTQENGTGTFSGLQTTYTGDGTEYATGDTLPIGILYEVSAFASGGNIVPMALRLFNQMRG